MRQLLFASDKCHNTAFYPAACYGIQIRQIRSQISTNVSILWHSLMTSLSPVLSTCCYYFTLCTILTLSLLSHLFPSEASQAGIYGPLGRTEAAEAAAGSAAPPPSSSSSSSSPLSSSTPAFCPASISSRQIVERQPRMLNFRVEYRQRSVDLVMEEGSTVGEFVSQYVRTKPTYPSANPLHSYICIYIHLQEESKKSLSQSSGFPYPKCS